MSNTTAENPNVLDCPECYVGKCRNCEGSWNTKTDLPAPCPCAQKGHPRSKS